MGGITVSGVRNWGEEIEGDIEEGKQERCGFDKTRYVGIHTRKIMCVI